MLVCGRKSDARDYWQMDDNIGKELPEKLVQAAKRGKLEALKVLKDWSGKDRPTDEQVVSARWVNFNSSDKERPDFQSLFFLKGRT